MKHIADSFNITQPYYSKYGRVKLLILQLIINLFGFKQMLVGIFISKSQAF